MRPVHPIGRLVARPGICPDPDPSRGSRTIRHTNRLQLLQPDLRRVSRPACHIRPVRGVRVVTSGDEGTEICPTVTGWPPASRSTASICERWPTGCSARPSDAEDAVQDTWLRLTSTDASEVENLGAWLTTVVARVSLNMLRARKHRHEEPVGDSWPALRRWRPRRCGRGPARSAPSCRDPEDEAVLADSVGLALLVVLDTLTPAERLAFVLHDMFAMPFEEVATVLGRSPEATRQLASRARRRVRGAASPDRAADLARQREVATAFLTAARGGDLSALVALLDSDVVLTSDAAASRPDGRPSCAARRWSPAGRSCPRPGPGSPSWHWWTGPSASRSLPAGTSRWC